jgi:hypothetical protein
MKRSTQLTDISSTPVLSALLKNTSLLSLDLQGLQPWQYPWMLYACRYGVPP